MITAERRSRIAGVNMQDMSFPGGFSVLMAVYINDNPSLFKRALQSICDNSLAPDQVVLVIDGPISLGLEQVVAEYQAILPMEVKRLPTNLGLASALNEGLSLVKTSWIVRADADDWNVPERFSKLASHIRTHPEVDLLGSWILEVDESGTSLAVRTCPTDHASIIAKLPFRCVINHPTVAYRKECIEKVGGYPHVYRKEDYGLWCLLMVNNIRFKNIDEILVHATAGLEMYRRRGGWPYVKSEFAIQKLMYEIGIKSIWMATIHFLFRGTVFSMPAKLRGIIYRKFLRAPA